jgi:hypothetical protein
VQQRAARSRDAKRSEPFVVEDACQEILISLTRTLEDRKGIPSASRVAKCEKAKNRPSEGTGVKDREISLSGSSQGERPSVWR